MAANPLQRLSRKGQSVWLDFISRELVTGDSLQRLVTGSAVTGLTSNPTIFAKAIEHGSDYDEQLRSLVHAGVTSPEELFLELAISDIQRAADILRPVYDRTGGQDGFVSLELPPALAHDTDGSVETAQEFWTRVERPNLMVKVPGTPEGIPAVERLIAAGVNVNITLLFSVAMHQAVMEAYLRGLEKRRDQGQPLEVRSVASFFVSRVDTMIDPLLDDRRGEPGVDDAELEALQGRAAIANARLAYANFLEAFGGERFRALAAKGASVQRPLWASTSTKNPNYRDVVYVEELVGPDTVNTMPPQTVDAFRDHGEVNGDTVRDVDSARDVMRRLAAAGIDIDRVTRDLLAQGLESFAASYDDLIRAIAEKADRFRGGPGTRQRFDLAGEEAVLQRALASQSALRTVTRIWDRDPDLWKPGDEHHAGVIRNRLGWLDVVGAMRGHAHQLTSFAEEVRHGGVQDVVLLGMGGSSLGPEVLRTAFGHREGWPRLHVLDTTDPVTVDAVTRAIDLRASLFIVASKSGGTIETLSHLAHFWGLVHGAGLPEPGRAFVAITDPGTSLAQIGSERHFRHVFENPADIGGRYSVLSYFGLVPAALAGIDVGRLLDRAEEMVRQCMPETVTTLNTGLALGTAMSLMHEMGRDKVTILAPPAVAAFSLWAEQLIAESTGKEGKGLIPIGAEPVGAPDVYGGDRLFVALRLGDDAEHDTHLEALRGAGEAVVTLDLRDRHDLAGEFFRWEFATAVAGAALGIDPFDEPNVKESKDNTAGVLDFVARHGKLPDDDEPAAEPAAAVHELLASVSAGDYVALMAYVPYGDENEAALQELRTAIRDRHRVATTLGFGPRFLHSTGQLHKGGPNTGVFLQVTCDDPVDVSIPDRPYTFSLLKGAQSRGDLRSLRDHGRRVRRVHLGGDLPAALRRLAASVRNA